MRIFLISVFIILFSVNLFAEDLHLARLNYSGGGDWYNNSEVLPNLAKFFNENISETFSLDQIIVKAKYQSLIESPFIYVTGHGNIKFNNSEVSSIRKYLLNGGFLYVDDDYGLDKSFRKEIKKVFPEKKLIEIPPSHEIFHCYYDFPKGLPKTHKHDDKRPQMFGIFDDFGRLMIIYTYESNISDGWANPNTHHDPENVRLEALKMGANILYYIITK